ncbi:hypothetical protein AGATL06_25020 [Agathobaculum sp. TL06]
MFTPKFLLSGDFLRFEPLLLERFHTHIRYAAKDLILDLFNDRSKYCYYILQGSAAYTLRHSNGDEKLSTFRGKGTIFPLYFSFESTNMDYFLEVTAVTDIELLQIPKVAFRALMEEYPAIPFAMIDAYARYTALLNYDIASQVFDSVKVKICSFLWTTAFSDQHSAGLPITLTHEEIGRAVGVTRANVSRILSELRSEKIISTTRHSIRILDKDRLFQSCSCILSVPASLTSDGHD